MDPDDNYMKDFRKWGLYGQPSPYNPSARDYNHIPMDTPPDWHNRYVPEDHTYEPENEEIIPLYSPEPVSTFEDMDLRPEVLRGLYARGLEAPSYIQERAIIPIIEGRDIIVQGKSGTGKTDAVIIGILHHIDTSDYQCQVIIIEPTHELAKQTTEAVKQMGQFMNIKVATLIGGSRFFENVGTLMRGIHVAVCTIGRLLDLLDRGYFETSNVKVLVLDEFDQLLQKPKDREKMDEILIRIRVYRIQLVLASATTNQYILRSADHIMVDPVHILLKRKELDLYWIDQYIVKAASREDKLKKLLDFFCNNDIIGQTLIFCNRKLTVNWLINRLIYRNYNAIHIHQDLRDLRPHHMQEFLENRKQILVTSDLMSRGIDIQQISHVINFDVPDRYATYIHRIGRSGRYGRRGTAITFVEPSEMEAMAFFMKLNNTKFKELTIDTCMPSTQWINTFLAVILCNSNDSHIDWSRISLKMTNETNEKVYPKRCEDVFRRLVGLYADVLENATNFVEASQWFVYFKGMAEIDLSKTGLSYECVDKIRQLSERLKLNDYKSRHPDLYPKPEVKP